MSKKPTKFSKNCPQCNKLQTYTTFKRCKSAIKTNTKCYKCSNGRRITPKKYCIDCGIQVTKYARAVKRCKPCADKQPKSAETLMKMSASLKGITRTQEQKKRISEALKKYHLPLVKERLKVLPKKQAYYRMVKTVTHVQPFQLLPNYDKRGKSGEQGAYQLDHKYSKAQGFKNNIPPEIIGHICNLEFIPWRQNAIKEGKCSISIIELQKAIKNHDTQLQLR